MTADDEPALLHAWKVAGDVDSLVGAALDTSANAGVRFFAARFLADFDDAAVVVALTALLADTDPRLRQQAARSLKQIGPAGRAAVPALLEALFDGDGGVRVAAARALGAIGDTSAIPKLVKAAETTGWDTLHSWVTDSLLRLGAPEAAIHLMRRLDSEKAWQRRWAARELAGVGPADAVALLRFARKRDPLHRRTYSRAIRRIERRHPPEQSE